MDKKAFTLINILRNVVTIYFDTFFAIYFFNLTNYEILPLAKYYVVVYASLLFGFWLLKNTIKKNNKVPFYRIGISLTALYLALIMLLKEKIVDYIFIVAFIKGLGEGFYYYPRNVLNASKITNKSRRKYDGIINSINQISSIVIPLLLGILLTFFDYVTIGKVVFVLMIIIFVLSFFVKEEFSNDRPMEVIKFFNKIKNNKKVVEILLIQFFKGFTVTSGVIMAVMTIYKILYFKSNLIIGSLDSVLGLLTFITCLLYASKTKKTFYRPLILITSIILSICLIILGLNPNNIVFIVYLVIYATGIKIITLLADTLIANKTNDLLIKFNKEEYHLILETVLGISRIGGYLVLLVIGFIGEISLLKYILFFSVIPFSLLGFYLIKNIDSLE